MTVLVFPEYEARPYPEGLAADPEELEPRLDELLGEDLEEDDEEDEDEALPPPPELAAASKPTAVKTVKRQNTVKTFMINLSITFWHVQNTAKTYQKVHRGPF